MLEVSQWSEGGEVSWDNPMPVTMGGSFSVDAFLRQRVSNPETLFDSASRYQNSALIWETDLTGSATATHNSDDSTVDLTVTTGATDRVVRQTRQYWPYQPGKSQFVIGTFNMMASGGTLSIVKRSKVTGAVVETDKAQNEWTENPLDGTDALKPTLDGSKAVIFYLDLEWLGVGHVRTGFIIDGRAYEAHHFSHSNVIASTYMTTATLPVRYEIVNDATNTTKYFGYGDDDNGIFIKCVEPKAATTLKSICCSVVTEGGFETGFGVPFKADNGVTPIAVTTRRALLTIRPKSTFNSIVNRALILPQDFSVYAQTNSCFYELVFGGTLGGSPSWADVNAQSAVEYDVAGTTVTGGVPFKSGYVPAGGSGANVFSTAQVRALAARLPLALNLDGTHPTSPYTDNLSLVATSMSGTSNVTGVLDGVEIR